MRPFSSSSSSNSICQVSGFEKLPSFGADRTRISGRHPVIEWQSDWRERENPNERVLSVHGRPLMAGRETRSLSGIDSEGFVGLFVSAIRVIRVFAHRKAGKKVRKKTKPSLSERFPTTIDDCAILREIERVLNY